MKILIPKEELSAEKVKEFLHNYKDPNFVHKPKSEGGKSLLPGMYLTNLLKTYSNNGRINLGISEFEVNFVSPIFYPRELNLVYEQNSPKELIFNFVNGNNKTFANGRLAYSPEMNPKKDFSKLDLIMSIGGKLQNSENQKKFAGHTPIYSYQGMFFAEDSYQEDLELIIQTQKETEMQRGSKLLKIKTDYVQKGQENEEKIIAHGFAEVAILEKRK